MGGRCGQCGAPASPSGRPARCPACQLPASAAVPGAGPAGAAAWLPAAERAGAGGDLGAILRGYRRACALTQQQLADVLGYDRTYISMIESGRGYPASPRPPTPEACMVLPSPQIPRRRGNAAETPLTRSAEIMTLSSSALPA